MCPPRTWALRGAAASFAIALSACGDHSPRILASHEAPVRTGSLIDASDAAPDEAAKISRLINVARASGLVFVRARRELTAGEFGDHMLTTYRRHTNEIDKARDLIERATRQKSAARPVMVRTKDGTDVAARDWLHTRLDEIESGAVAGSQVTQKAAQVTERALRISDVLAIIDGAPGVFIVPARKGPPKTMNGRAFAQMLQQKWEWLGRDIEDVDTFVTEIASDSFAAFEPYLIQHEDKTTQPVATWLKGQVEHKREALSTAQVGSL